MKMCDRGYQCFYFSEVSSYSSADHIWAIFTEIIIEKALSRWEVINSD